MLNASGKVQEKARRIAASMLEAAFEDVELSDGRYQVKGVPAKSLALAAIAERAYGEALAPGLEPGLEATDYFRPPNLVYPFGAHVAVVEVDRDTGRVEVREFSRWTTAGSASALCWSKGRCTAASPRAWRRRFSRRWSTTRTASSVTGSLMDYALPRAEDLPSFTTDQTVTVTPRNPLGAKGHRRGRHHRLDPRRGQCRGGRLAPVRRAPPRHAAPRRARVAGHRRGRPDSLRIWSTVAAIAHAADRSRKRRLHDCAARGAHASEGHLHNPLIGVVRRNPELPDLGAGRRGLELYHHRAGLADGEDAAAAEVGGDDHLELIRVEADERDRPEHQRGRAVIPHGHGLACALGPYHAAAEVDEEWAHGDVGRGREDRGGRPVGGHGHAAGAGARAGAAPARQASAARGERDVWCRSGSLRSRCRPSTRCPPDCSSPFPTLSRSWTA